MKIQLINSSKLKIIFNKSDLDENNIPLHSFLSGSLISQKFIKSIIEIAYEDFGFSVENNNFLYEIFCFDFSEFIIIISKNSNSTTFLYNPQQLAYLNKRDSFRENNNSENLSFKFNHNKLLKSQNLFFFFNEFEEFLLFSEYIKNGTLFQNINSTLYKYANLFLLEISTANLLPHELKSFLSFSYEIKNYFCASELTLIKFKEFAKILCSDNALNL